MLSDTNFLRSVVLLSPHWQTHSVLLHLCHSKTRWGRCRNRLWKFLLLQSLLWADCTCQGQPDNLGLGFWSGEHSAETPMIVSIFSWDEIKSLEAGDINLLEHNESFLVGKWTLGPTMAVVDICLPLMVMLNQGREGKERMRHRARANRSKQTWIIYSSHVALIPFQGWSWWQLD